jgi:hypothetical protein
MSTRLSTIGAGLVLALLCVVSAAAAANPTHGGGKGAISAVCSAAKGAWSSGSKCSAFKSGICATVASCGGGG